MEYTKLIHERYSVRKYKKDPVEEEKIAAILEAARVAPTAKKCPPQKIYLVRSEKVFAYLAGNAKDPKVKARSQQALQDVWKRKGQNTP